MGPRFVDHEPAFAFSALAPVPPRANPMADCELDQLRLFEPVAVKHKLTTGRPSEA